MEYLEFCSKIISTSLDFIKSFIWPTVILIVLILFRAELKKALERLEGIKYQGLEITFSRLKAKASKLLKGKTRQRAKIDRKSGKLKEEALEAAVNNPPIAIMLAWKSLESLLREIAMDYSLISKEQQINNPTHLITMLVEKDNLNAEQSELITELLLIRNRVSHEVEVMRAISSRQALDYVNIAYDTIDYL